MTPQPMPSDAVRAAKPMPVISQMNQAFWDYAQRSVLSQQYCTHCQKYWAPVSPVCPHCLATDFVWKPVSGRGRLSSWVVFHKVYIAAFAAEAPYNVALIELDEGPRMLSSIVGSSTPLTVGARVEVVFEKHNDSFLVPKFRLARDMQA